MPNTLITFDFHRYNTIKRSTNLNNNGSNMFKNLRSIKKTSDTEMILNYIIITL